MADDQKRITVQHADLYDLVGHTATSDGFTFVPIQADIHNLPEYPSFWLSEFAHQISIPFETDVLLDVVDPSALFVRAVLPSVFGFVPPHIADGRYALLDMAFAVGVVPPDDRLIPFACVDSNLDAGIAFPEGCLEGTVRDRIVSAFWSLLIRHRTELSDFDADGISWCHPDGYDTQVRVGLRGGTYYAWDMFPQSEVDT